MILVEYSYLGLKTIVRANYAGEPGVELTYLKQGEEGNGEAGDQYAGLDRFGRVVDQRWLKTSTGAAVERIQYGFDWVGNRTYRDNLVAPDNKKQDEIYAYDELYQLNVLKRGSLSGGTISDPAWEEDFKYDPTGNWHGPGSENGYETKTDGNTDLAHNRTHNKANELTGITTNSGPEWVAPVHDKAGNMTSIPRPNAPTNSYACTYDAWNRLVKVMDGQNTVGTYQYDGQNRRTTKVTGSTTRHLFYSDKWQVLEERVGESVDRQFVWGQRHIDDLALRDKGGQRHYVIQDAFHVTGITDTNGTVQQRYGYDAFGTPRVMNPDWTTTNPTPTDYEWETRFVGYRWDSESALYQVRNRNLHHRLGRWTMRDTLEYARSAQLYAYVDNDAVNQIDPSGEGPLDTLVENAIVLALATMFGISCPCITSGSWTISGLKFKFVSAKGKCPPTVILRPLLQMLAPPTSSGTVPATPCPADLSCKGASVYTIGPQKLKSTSPGSGLFPFGLPKYPQCIVTIQILEATVVVAISIGKCA